MYRRHLGGVLILYGRLIGNWDSRLLVKLMHRVWAVSALLLGVALTLASVFLLLHMTLRAELMEDALPRTFAMLGALVAGVLLLMGSVYISTRIAVFLFASLEHREIPFLRKKEPPRI